MKTLTCKVVKLMFGSGQSIHALKGLTFGKKGEKGCILPHKMKVKVYTCE